MTAIRISSRCPPIARQLIPPLRRPLARQTPQTRRTKLITTAGSSEIHRRERMTSMFTINHHALRRMRTAAVSGTLAALTVGGALLAAGTASADQVVQNTYTIAGSNSINVAIHCPDGMVLNNTSYSSNDRAVPHGVEVIEAGTAVGVNMGSPSTIDDINGKRFKSASGTATNWSPFTQDLIIKGHCVNA